MDIITATIVVALANLGKDVIQDSYQALKVALRAKCGVDSDLVEAVEKLEQKPNSEARQAMLEEEVALSKIDQDPEIRKVAEAILEQLNTMQDKSSSQVKVEISGGTVQGIIGATQVDVETMSFGNSPDEK